MFLFILQHTVKTSKIPSILKTLLPGATFFNASFVPSWKKTWMIFHFHSTNIWAKVRKLEEHLNPKGGKMRIQLTTLKKTHLLIFYRNDSIKVSFDGRGYFSGLRVTKRNKAMVLLTLTLLQTPTLTLTLPYSKFVSKPILKKKVLTKCHSEVSEIVDASFDS